MTDKSSSVVSPQSSFLSGLPEPISPLEQLVVRWWSQVVEGTSSDDDLVNSWSQVADWCYGASAIFNRQDGGSLLADDFFFLSDLAAHRAEIVLRQPLHSMVGVCDGAR